MDFHIDRKTGYLLAGTLIIGMIIGAWLSNLSMHHHMSRMMRGGDMGMMQGGMRDGKDMKDMKHMKNMMRGGSDMDQPAPAGQMTPDQAMPEPQMVPGNQ